LLGAVEVVAPVRAKSYLYIGHGCVVPYNPKTELHVIVKAKRTATNIMTNLFFNFSSPIFIIFSIFSTLIVFVTE